MSDRIKNKVIENILILSANVLSQEQRVTMQGILWMALKGYDIVETSKELVPFENSNESIIKRFLANKMLEGCTKRTIEYYSVALRQYTQASQKPLVETETGDIKTYLAIGMTRGWNSRGKWGHITVDNVRRILNSFFKWMSEEELIERNPMLRVKKVKIPKVVKEAFSYTDMEKIRLACGDDVRLRALVEVLLSTACRVSEIAEAKLSNLQLQKGVLKVWGKGNKERIVYLNAAAKVWLQRYLDTRQDETDSLFVRQCKPYKPLLAASIEDLIRLLGKAAGVTNCHPHRFRRTAATWAGKRGMRLEQIQKMLGHEQISTTMIYTQVDQQDVQIAHERYLGG